jgi:uncharacterized protein YndB with AHSA1/START domain
MATSQRHVEGQSMEIEVNVQDHILKPVHQVFAAVVDPEKISQYFVSRASGPMKAGAIVEWEFADVGAKGVLEVLEVEENRKVVFESGAAAARTRVTMQFSAAESNSTLMTVNESKFPMDSEGVKCAMGQTAGWTYFLACLKAYLQFGINLRAGLQKRLTDV